MTDQRTQEPSHPTNTAESDENRTRFEQQDPGAYIGNEPEFEDETIPGGVKPGDERVAAYDSRPGVDGEPDDNEITTGSEEFPSAPGE